jgi:hypothetical protein
MYKITNRQKRNADALFVKIKPSTLKGKKIDVFDIEGNKITSIGALGYMDYDSYLKTKGIKFANERRRLYQIRHANDRNKKGTAGYYADKILW